MWFHIRNAENERNFSDCWFGTENFGFIVPVTSALYIAEVPVESFLLRDMLSIVC